MDANETLSAALPDLSLCYKLHLECGRFINLYDWLQAFIAIVQPDKNSTDDSNVVKKKGGKIVKQKKNIDDKLQYPFFLLILFINLKRYLPLYAEKYHCKSGAISRSSSKSRLGSRVGSLPIFEGAESGMGEMNY